MLLVIYIFEFLLLYLTLAEFVSPLHANALFHLNYTLLWNFLRLEIVSWVILILWKVCQTLTAYQIEICVLCQLALGLVSVFKMCILWSEYIFLFLRRCLRSNLNLTFRMGNCLLFARLSSLGHRDFLKLKLRIVVVLPWLLFDSIRLFLRIWKKLGSIGLNGWTSNTKPPTVVYTKLLLLGLSLSKIVLAQLSKSIVDVAVCSIHILYLILISNLHLSLQCNRTAWPLFKGNRPCFLDWDCNSCTCRSFRHPNLSLTYNLTFFWVINVDLTLIINVILW